MNDPLRPLLDRQGVIILDGALATELERRGADLDDPLWSGKVLLEQPELIRAVHEDYLRAGADIIITASYQVTFKNLAARGLSRSESIAVFLGSTSIAQEARQNVLNERNGGDTPTPLIAASVGCYGAALGGGAEYRGDYGISKAELIEFHRPRMAVLADSGADLLACETIPCLLETEALIELLDEFPGTPAWFTFTCRDESRLRNGEPLAEAIALARECPNVVAAGINCTDPRYVAGLLRSIKNIARVPLAVYPNSGETWDPANKRWISTRNPFDFAAGAAEWYRHGAKIMGGCCRTTTDTIRAIVEWRDRALG